MISVISILFSVIGNLLALIYKIKNIHSKYITILINISQVNVERYILLTIYNYSSSIYKIKLKNFWVKGESANSVCLIHRITPYSFVSVTHSFLELIHGFFASHLVSLIFSFPINKSVYFSIRLSFTLSVSLTTLLRLYFSLT